jgi:hypothetical protein
MAQGFAALALALTLAQGVESQAVEYYVGIDGRAVIPTGLMRDCLIRTMGGSRFCLPI